MIPDDQYIPRLRICEIEKMNPHIFKNYVHFALSPFIRHYGRKSRPIFGIIAEFGPSNKENL